MQTGTADGLRSRVFVGSIPTEATNLTSTMYFSRVYHIFICMRTDIINRKDEILTWISENKSKAFISKQLACKQDTLNQYLVEMNIDYAGNMSGKGTLKSKVQLYDILSNKIAFHTGQLKKRLIFDKILENKCCECSNTGEWNGKPMTLELDHINGDSNDNSLENLRILCPNCHSQTPTFRKKKTK